MTDKRRARKIPFVPFALFPAPERGFSSNTYRLILEGRPRSRTDTKRPPDAGRADQQGATYLRRIRIALRGGGYFNSSTTRAGFDFQSNEFCACCGVGLVGMKMHGRHEPGQREREKKTVDSIDRNKSHRWTPGGLIQKPKRQQREKETRLTEIDSIYTV
jgi:hypothetical protein